MFNRMAAAVSALLFGAMVLPISLAEDTAAFSSSLGSEPQAPVVMAAPCNPKLTLCQ